MFNNFMNHRKEFAIIKVEDDDDIRYYVGLADDQAVYTVSPLFAEWYSSYEVVQKEAAKLSENGQEHSVVIRYVTMPQMYQK